MTFSFPGTLIVYCGEMVYDLSGPKTDSWDNFPIWWIYLEQNLCQTISMANFPFIVNRNDSKGRKIH